MFVRDGAKARIAALAMTAVTALPILPSAIAGHAVKPRASTTQTSEVKAATKTKKKKSNADDDKKRASLTYVAVAAWRPPTVGQVFRPAKQKADPLEIVLAAARKQLGKPYRYGATGPSSFDCSGFTMFVWKEAGVKLPRTSGAQYGALPHVPQKKARLGDLVYSPGHIGLYIGDGKMIHSPHSGRSVEVSPIHGNTSGFARPKASD